MSRAPHSPQITITCPECQAQQLESRLAVSTMCRACNAGIQIQDGVALRRTPLIKLSVKPKPPEAKTSQAAPKTSSVTSKLFPFHTKSPIPSIGAPNLIQRYLHSTPEKRSVVCTECHREHQASVSAQASHCLACGAYISLRNYEINENWHRRIQTRGDVHIQKKGSVQGVMIQCHNLIIEGIFRGSVECSGDVVFLQSTKILGKIACRHLHVPINCELESQHPIHTHSALIEGKLHGSIVATGGVTLDKKALVEGDITAGNIVIKPGAKQNGMIVIKQSTVS